MSEEQQSPSTLETVESQLPAIQQLHNLGYKYITPIELDRDAPSTHHQALL